MVRCLDINRLRKDCRTEGKTVSRMCGIQKKQGTVLRHIGRVSKHDEQGLWSTVKRLGTRGKEYDERVRSPAVPPSKACCMHTLCYSPPIVKKQVIGFEEHQAGQPAADSSRYSHHATRYLLQWIAQIGRDGADGTPTCRGISQSLLPAYFCENRQWGPATFFY